ncbi:hypothetical protein QYF36_002815 [Acer negundo]|nr:hypothetical protein QYF36_002815 [Acer negundo]
MGLKKEINPAFRVILHLNPYIGSFFPPIPPSYQQLHPFLIYVTNLPLIYIPAQTGRCTLNTGKESRRLEGLSGITQDTKEKPARAVVPKWAQGNHSSSHKPMTSHFQMLLSKEHGKSLWNIFGERKLSVPSLCPNSRTKAIPEEEFKLDST